MSFEGWKFIDDDERASVNVAAEVEIKNARANDVCVFLDWLVLTRDVNFMHL